MEHIKSTAHRVNQATLALWLRCTAYTSRYFSDYQGRHRAAFLKG